MIRDLQDLVDVAALAEAARGLGIHSPEEAIDRALDLVLLVGETLRGVIARFVSTCQFTDASSCGPAYPFSSSRLPSRGPFGSMV